MKDEGRLKSFLELVSANNLFCDPDFEADDNAIYYNEESRSYADGIKWLRPKVAALS